MSTITPPIPKGIPLRRHITISPPGSSTKIITVNPAETVEIDAEGQGTLTIQFVGQNIPSPLQPFVSTSNPRIVTIPVNGEVKLILTGVTEIQVTGNVEVKIKAQFSGIVTLSAPKVSINENHVVSVQVSNGNITSMTHNNQHLPITKIIKVGFDPITFVGYGVQLIVQDFDPVSGNPVSPQYTIDLSNGTSSNPIEYPSGGTLLASRTGYIYISNISGSGQFSIFKAVPKVSVGIGEENVFE